MVCNVVNSSLIRDICYLDEQREVTALVNRPCALIVTPVREHNNLQDRRRGDILIIPAISHPQQGKLQVKLP